MYTILIYWEHQKNLFTNLNAVPCLTLWKYFFFKVKWFQNHLKYKMLKHTLAFYDTLELTKDLSPKPFIFSLGCLTIFSLRKSMGNNLEHSDITLKIIICNLLANVSHKK